MTNEQGIGHVGTNSSADLDCRYDHRSLPNNNLIYLVFIAPDKRYSEMKNIIVRMLSSFSVNDTALQG